MFKRTSLIIFVTFLVIFNTVLNSYVSCCETREERFLNNDEQGCCICCSNAVDNTFLTNPSLGKSQATIDDGDSCVCIPYASTSESYFVFTKRSFLPFHFSPFAPTAAFVENKVTTKQLVFFPTRVDQKTVCLSTVVLLI